MLTVDLDTSVIEKVVAAAVDKAMEKHSFMNNLPALLTKTQFMELLDIGSTKAAELFNRQDFPVCRELGHPRVPTKLLFQWIEDHTDWVQNNAGNDWHSKRRGA